MADEITIPPGPPSPIPDLGDEIEEQRLKEIWGLRLRGFNLPNPGALPNDPILANVRAPGQAIVNAVGARAPVAGAQNWIPRGPRNIGGRCRGLAIHPNFDNILFAGSGSGGVFKSENGGETWFPLFHEQASLSIAAISVHHTAGDPVDQTTIWVATGELHFNAFPVAGAGVFRSIDNGANFQQVATVAQLDNSELLEAIACHPANRDHCWVVGPRGAFRITIDPVTHVITREQFDAGVEYSDVAFGDALPAAGPPVGPRPHEFVVYLCRARTARGDIVRIDDPTAAAAVINPLFAAGAASIAQPIPAGGIPPGPALGPPLGVLPSPFPAGSTTTRAKLTVSKAVPAPGERGSVAFVVYARDRGYVAIFRANQVNNRPAFNAVAWNQLPDGDAVFDLRQGEGQVDYNLTIGVSPRDPNHLFLGMVSLYFHANANHALPGAPPAVNWRKSVEQARLTVTQEIHPDHHTVVFEQVRNPPNVFVANDNSIFFNDDYHLAGTTFFPMLVTLPPAFAVTRPSFPLTPEPTHRWQRRHDGLHASQPFDVTTSPVSPTLYGSGFVDNSVWFSSGGDTWRFIVGGDGGFVAWDPVDPYQLIGTWQGMPGSQLGANAASFAGGIQDLMPTPPPFPVILFTATRPLDTQFLDVDAARFIGDLIMHPTKPFHVLTTRQNRVYRSENADSFDVVQAGTTVEILFHVNFIAGAPEAEFFGIEFERTPGAVKLGFFDSVFTLGDFTAGVDAEANCRCLAGNPGPWQLDEGDELRFTFHRVGILGVTPLTRTAVVVRFTSGAGIEFLARARPHEVAAVIQRAITAAAVLGGRALPCFLNGPISIELRTTQVGAAASIRLVGNAADALGVSPGTYSGAPNRHASLTLQTKNLNAVIATPNTPIDDVDLTGLALQVAVDGGALQNVPLNAASLGSVRHPSGTLIAGAIAGAAGAGFQAVPITTRKALILLSDTGTFTVGGTAAPLLGNLAAQVAGAGIAVPALLLQLARWTFTPLAPVAGVARRLILTPTGGGAVNIDFTGPPVLVDQTRATAEEISARINARLVAAGVAAVDLRCVVVQTVAAGDPSELAFAPSAPDHVWIGSSNGHVLRSVDYGRTWDDVTGPLFQLRDRMVEAIAVHPSDPRTVYVGLAGTGLPPANDAGFLFKTTQAERTDAWVHIGGTIRGTDGNLLAINAIEIDPARPQNVYVATPAGVWASTNSGADWAEFSQGLPNCIVMDLSLEPTTRTLRAALWGRGIWERHVGTLAAQDRRIFLRSTFQDQGRRPVLEGFDGFATFPQIASLSESPDIKNNPLRPFEIDANDANVDGVEFDEVLVHEEPVEGNSTIFVQLHNHGSFPATNVTVTVLWAETDCGPPPLTPAFWTSWAANAPVAPPRWTLVGGPGRHALAGELVVGHPRILGIPVVWPASIGDANELAILVLITSPDDPLTSRAVDVAELIRAEPRAAVRITQTRRLRDAREILLVANRGATVDVTGGTVVAQLGLPPPGPARFIRSAGGTVGAGGPGTFDLTGVAAPRTIVISDGIGPAATVTFRPPEIPDPPNSVTAGQIRRAINRELRIRQIFARAIVGRTDLSIAASVTEAGDRPLALPSSHLADFVVRQGASVGAGARPALFELIARLEPDRLQRNVVNHFYLRITNRGNVDQPNVRCRIYHLVFPVAAAPVHDAQAVLAPGVDAGGVGFEEVDWNPGALAGIGAWAVILVTVQNDDNEPLALPATGFANIDELRTFCRGRNNAAYRVMPVG